MTWGTLFEVKPKRNAECKPKSKKHLASVGMEELYEFHMAAVVNYHNLVASNNLTLLS